MALVAQVIMFLGEPTTPPGVVAEVGTLGIRTDDQTFWQKTAAAPTAWQQLPKGLDTVELPEPDNLYQGIFADDSDFAEDDLSEMEMEAKVADLLDKAESQHKHLSLIPDLAGSSWDRA